MCAILKGFRSAINKEPGILFQLSNFENNNNTGQSCFVPTEIHKPEDIKKNFFLIHSSFRTGESLETEPRVSLLVNEDNCKIIFSDSAYQTIDTPNWRLAVSRYCQEVHDRIYPLGNPKITT